MKTQNTPEQKAKFFALYWGQKILVLDGLASNVDSWIEGNNINSFTLNLKSLSAISDEDAIEVATLCGHRVEYLRKGRADIEEFVDGEYTLSLAAIDFLRSKGYLIGWMDLTPEDIIAYGWVRLEVEG